jgi:hypothetical protein
MMLAAPLLRSNLLLSYIDIVTAAWTKDVKLALLVRWEVKVPDLLASIQGNRYISPFPVVYVHNAVRD